MSRIADFVTQFGSIFAGQIAAKVKTFLLIIGLAGTGIGAWMFGEQAYAAMSYTPSVATVTASGYRCQAVQGWRACTREEIDRAEETGGKVKNEFRVTFRFADASGAMHQVTGYITRTGLPRDEAVPGAQFNMLYDPNDPTMTSLPLGADYHAMVVALAGIAALCLYVFFFGLPFGWSRRAADA